MAAFEEPPAPTVRRGISEDAGQRIAQIASLSGRVKWPGLEGENRLQRTGAGIPDPGLAIGKGRELPRSGLRKAQPVN